jgi:hypothetical protein
MKTINLFRLACASVILIAAAPVFAQSCVNTIPIASGGNFNGNTCSGTNQLPALANGAIQASGPQAIYALQDLSAIYLNETFTLTAAPSANLSVFVCRNPCSTYASCVAVADVGSGGSGAAFVSNPAAYFVVIGSAAGTCGAYSLTVSGTFND